MAQAVVVDMTEGMSECSLNSLNGFGMLAEAQKDDLINKCVTVLQQGMTDDFIDFCVRLEENIGARISLKHILNQQKF